MKRFSEQFKNKADDIHLNTTEKRELRERVVSYMEYHPLSVSVKRESLVTLNEEMSFKMIKFDVGRFLKLSSAFVIVLTVSISLLAEKAVPGDALYAVKVSFNEEMRSTLARGSYEKVVWETERLNRRIAEARLLADEGRLTTEVEEQVADAVREHSENARKEIENLKLTDKDEATMASIELATALDVQTTSLRNRSDLETDGQSTTLIESILVESQAVEARAEEDSLPAYDRLMAKVESETTRAHELLEGVKNSATTEEQTDIRRRLDDIERKIAAAIQLFAADEVIARQGLVEVLQQTHRLIVFMTNIDVRASVTVDQIVPVTLTNEERINLVKKQADETTTLLSLVENALSASSTIEIPLDILDKTKPAFLQSSTTLEKVQLLLLEEAFDIRSAETLSLEAYNTIFDIVSLLNLSVGSTTENTEIVEEVPVVEEVKEEIATTSDTLTSPEVIEIEAEVQI